MLAPVRRASSSPCHQRVRPVFVSTLTCLYQTVNLAGGTTKQGSFVVFVYFIFFLWNCKPVESLHQYQCSPLQLLTILTAGDLLPLLIQRTLDQSLLWMCEYICVPSTSQSVHLAVWISTILVYFSWDAICVRPNDHQLQTPSHGSNCVSKAANTDARSERLTDLAVSI